MSELLVRPYGAESAIRRGVRCQHGHDSWIPQSNRQGFQCHPCNVARQHKVRSSRRPITHRRSAEL